MHHKNEYEDRKQIEKTRAANERDFDEKASKEGSAIGRSRGYRIRISTNKS